MGSKKLAAKENNKNMIYNVRIVEDQTKESLSLKQVLSILILSLVIYFIFNAKTLYESIYVFNNFWDVFTETFKELIYSTGFSIVVFFVVSISNVAIKRKK